MRGWSAAAYNDPPRSPKSRLVLLCQMAEVRAIVIFIIGCALTYLLCFHGPRLKSHPWHIFIFVGFMCCLVRYIGAGGICCTIRPLPRTLAIVTGANSGVGLATTIGLLRSRITVIMAVRDVEKAYASLPYIQQQLGLKDPVLLRSMVRIMKLDLADCSSVRNFVEEFASLGLPCNILVNNAGALLSRHRIMKTTSSAPFFPGQSKTQFVAHDGGKLVEDTFATNYLGHFLLTLLLFPLLVRSSARVINLTSAFHMSVTSSIDVPSMNMIDPSKWTGPDAYARSKLCMIWFTRSLQRRFDALGCAAQTFAVHPGTVWSPFHMPFYRDSPFGLFMLFPALMAPMSYLCMKSAREGAQTTLHCIFGTHVEPGQHYAECALAACSEYAQDDDRAEQLWRYSLDLVGLTEKVVTRGPPPKQLTQGISTLTSSSTSSSSTTSSSSSSSPSSSSPPTSSLSSQESDDDNQTGDNDGSGEAEVAGEEEVEEEVERGEDGDTVEQGEVYEQDNAEEEGEEEGERQEDEEYAEEDEEVREEEILAKGKRDITRHASPARRVTRTTLIANR